MEEAKLGLIVTLAPEESVEIKEDEGDMDVNMEGEVAVQDLANGEINGGDVSAYDGESDKENCGGEDAQVELEEEAEEEEVGEAAADMNGTISSSAEDDASSSARDQSTVSDPESDDEISDCENGSDVSSLMGASPAKKLKRDYTTTSEALKRHRMLKKSKEPFLQHQDCVKIYDRAQKKRKVVTNAQFPLCIECNRIRKEKTNSKNICRFYMFRKIRYNGRGSIVAVDFPDKSSHDDSNLKLWLPIDAPKSMPLPLAEFLLREVGEHFCNLANQEWETLEYLKDQKDPSIKWRRVVLNLREMCDVCSTTLFNFHWTCRKCGFVVCISCFKARKNNEPVPNRSAEYNPEEREENGWTKCPRPKKQGTGTQWDVHNLEDLMLTQIMPGDTLQMFWQILRHLRNERGISDCGTPPGAELEFSLDDFEKLKENILSKNVTPNEINEMPRNGETVNQNTTDCNELADSSVEINSLVTSKTNGACSNSDENGLSELGTGHLKTTEVADLRNCESSTEGHSMVAETSSHDKMLSGIMRSTTDNTDEDELSALLNNNSETNEEDDELTDLLTDDNCTEKEGVKLAGTMRPDTDEDDLSALLTNNSNDEDEDDLTDLMTDDCTEKVQEDLNCRNYVRDSTAADGNNSDENRNDRAPRSWRLSESQTRFPGIDHTWHCRGYLLRLFDPLNDKNIKLFEEQWKRGQPVMVSKVAKYLDPRLWTPESFSEDFGKHTHTLINCMTGKEVNGYRIRDFWAGFEHVKQRLVGPDRCPMLLKLKDWPPKHDFAAFCPSRFVDLMQVLPLPEYTHRDGKRNLAARLPDIFNKPELGPKMYIAYGSGKHLEKGTTNLHLDISDAVNLMVHAGEVKDEDVTEHREAVNNAIKDSDCDEAAINRVLKDGEVPGALWHIFEAKDAKKIRDLINTIKLENGKRVEPQSDAIHDQNLYLDKTLRERLRNEYNVIGYPILQCAGDAIFIPAGAPHQVRNLNNCIKIAEDFVSPENVGHCFRLTEEFRNLSTTHTNHEDKLQIKNIVYHTAKDAVAVILASKDSKN